MTRETDFFFARYMVALLVRDRATLPLGYGNEAPKHCTHKSQRYILMSMYEQELHTAQRIAREAGDIMRRYFDGDQQRQTKADGTPVTIADTTINSLVIQRLHETFPDDGVIGEHDGLWPRAEVAVRPSRRHKGLYLGCAHSNVFACTGS